MMDPFQLVGLEDSSAPYEDRRRLGMEFRPPEDKSGTDEVGQVRACKKAYKNGTWPTWPTFFDGYDHGIRVRSKSIDRVFQRQL